jgi:hypothetical protein
MRCRALAVLCTLAISCGPDGPADGVSVSVDIHGLAPADVGAVQITVLKNATAYICSDLVRSCLKQRIDIPSDRVSDKVVPVENDGAKKNALRIAADGAALLGGGQQITLKVASGTNYMVVVEVLSPSAALLASGCEVLPVAQEGNNPPLVLRAQAFSTPPACDPRIDPAAVTQ